MYTYIHMIAHTYTWFSMNGTALLLSRICFKCTHVHIHTYMYAYIHTCTYTWFSMNGTAFLCCREYASNVHTSCTHVHIHKQMYILVHTLTCVCIYYTTQHTCMDDNLVNTLTCVYTCIHTVYIHGWHSCTYTDVCVCVYIYIYIYIYKNSIHTWMHTNYYKRTGTR